MELTQSRIIHRDLTDKFKQWRRVYHSTNYSPDDREDDTAALVINTSNPNSPDIVKFTVGGPSRSDPPWSAALKEVQYNLGRVRDKIEKLKVLQERHLRQPTISFEIGTAEQEQEIEIVTAEIAKLFHLSYKNLQFISNYAKQSEKNQDSHQNVQLVKNVMHAVASDMQNLSYSFKQAQSLYLRKRKRREDHAGQLLDTSFTPGVTDFAADDSFSQLDELQDIYVVDKGFTGNQLMVVTKDRSHLQDRDKEIDTILQSLIDINEIFKDMSTMVLDQGTILDRIDYNIEQTATKIGQAKIQLVKAEKIQKRSRWAYIIIVLTVVFALMVVIFMVLKILKVGIKF